jgi:GDPmannose 4,6-dehydratase
MPKAIVIGAGGMDGSLMCEHLLEKGYEVVGTANKSIDNLKKSSDYSSFSLELLDITNEDEIGCFFAKHPQVDEIYNFAGKTNINESYMKPDETWNTTGYSVELIVTNLVGFYKNRFKFFQALSSEMFGTSFSKDGKNYKYPKDKYILDDNCYKDENTPFIPVSPYGMAKMYALSVVERLRVCGINAKAGILFTHESSRRPHNFLFKKVALWLKDLSIFIKTHNISHITQLDFSSNYINHREYSIPKLKIGNLNIKRSWGYAPDFIKAIHTSMDTNIGNYVLCSEDVLSIGEVIKTHILQNFSVSNGVNIDNFITTDPFLGRPNDNIPFINGKCDLAKQELGFVNTKNVQDIIKEIENEQ